MEEKGSGVKLCADSDSGGIVFKAAVWLISCRRLPSPKTISLPKIMGAIKLTVILCLSHLNLIWMCYARPKRGDTNLVHFLQLLWSE